MAHEVRPGIYPDGLHVQILDGIENQDLFT